MSCSNQPSRKAEPVGFGILIAQVGDNLVGVRILIAQVRKKSLLDLECGTRGTIERDNRMGKARSTDLVIGLGVEKKKGKEMK